MKILQRLLAATLGLAIYVGTMPQDALARPLGSGFGFQEDYAPLSDSDLDALVAPIALYPDALVAQHRHRQVLVQRQARSLLAAELAAADPMGHRSLLLGLGLVECEP